MAPPVSTDTLPTDPLIFDLDEDGRLQHCLNIIKTTKANNFAVRFDASTARTAINLGEDQVERLLDPATRPSSQTLWLNFWASESQRPIIQAVAAHYKLSPRLTGFLCPVKRLKSPGKSTSADKTEPNAERSTKIFKRRHHPDVEKANGTAVQPKPARKPSTSDLLKQMSFVHVVSRLWHFCSVDWGQRYLYVGYNSLVATHSQEKEEVEDKPKGQRIWTSLLFCYDNTVISVFERPQRSDFGAQEIYNEVIAASTQHVANIFRHLSRNTPPDFGSSPLMTVNIRPDLPSASTENTTAHRTPDLASLLFYYLFDDWASTFKLIANFEHPYRETLNKLRKSMFSQPETDHVGTLHTVGRQLTVLKLMYQSYQLIVSRILERQRMVWLRQGSTQQPNSPLPPSSSSHYHHNDSRFSQNHHSEPSSPSLFEEYRRYNRAAGGESMHARGMLNEDAEFCADENISIRLSIGATVRFERLRDRIGLYALNEIDECLKEKDSLVFMVSTVA